MDINEVLREEHLFKAYVAEHGAGRTIEALNGILDELRLQRIQRQPLEGEPQEEFRKWLRSQAGFEASVKRRLRETTELLRVNGNPMRDMKARITELMEVIKKLSTGIDNTDQDYLLEQFSITLGDERMTLAEAIDAGKFA